MTLDLQGCCSAGPGADGGGWGGEREDTGGELSHLSRDTSTEGPLADVSYFSISANKSKLSVLSEPRRSIGSMSISPNLSTCPRSSTKSFRSPQKSKKILLVNCHVKTTG